MYHLTYSLPLFCYESQFEVTDTNKTNAFQIKAKLEMINVSVKQSNCIGLFCDRQNLDENNNTYGCGCYTSVDTRHAKLALNFYLQINGRYDFGNTGLYKS